MAITVVPRTPSQCVVRSGTNTRNMSAIRNGAPTTSHGHHPVFAAHLSTPGPVSQPGNWPAPARQRAQSAAHRAVRQRPADGRDDDPDRDGDPGCRRVRADSGQRRRGEGSHQSQARHRNHRYGERISRRPDARYPLRLPLGQGMTQRWHPVTIGGLIVGNCPDPAGGRPILGLLACLAIGPAAVTPVELGDDFRDSSDQDGHPERPRRAATTRSRRRPSARAPTRARPAPPGPGSTAGSADHGGCPGR